MRAGNLRSPVLIQQKEVTRDEFNGEQITWKDFVSRPASVEPLTGSEKYSEAQELATVRYKFRLRYDSKTKDITAGMRLIFNGITFDLDPPIIPFARNREIHLTGEAVV